MCIFSKPFKILKVNINSDKTINYKYMILCISNIKPLANINLYTNRDLTEYIGKVINITYETSFKKGYRTLLLINE